MIFISLVIAYFFGSIPSAVVISRAMSLSDPTLEGSRNPGVTNMMRVNGKKAATMTLVSDMFKGGISVGIGVWLQLSATQLLLVMFVCVVGHIFPIFNAFRGGKGVATFFGCLLVVSLPVGLVSLAVWLVVAKIANVSSLSAILSISITPLMGYMMDWVVQDLVLLCVICLLILLRHKDNIRRLLGKKELSV